MFDHGDKVVLTCDDYVGFGVMKGCEGIVVSHTSPLTGLAYCVVFFIGSGQLYIYDHHLSKVTPQQSTDNKQKFVDKDKMWEAIQSISKGQ